MQKDNLDTEEYFFDILKGLDLPNKFKKILKSKDEHIQYPTYIQSA